MLKKYELTLNNEVLFKITEQVQATVTESGVKEGIAIVFCPHTTAGITINENADEFVGTDVILGMKKSFPQLSEYRHDEGNSACHIKSSVFGASETVIITDGKLLMGKWQDIYFAEFDPPRQRIFYVKVIG